MNKTLGIDQSALSKNWMMFFLWGILLLILGIVAIGAAVMTTLISVVFIGALLVIGGIIVLLDSFTFWRRHQHKGFFLHFLMGILYFVAGFLLIKTPLLASISITLLLGIFYLLLGIFRLIYTFSICMPHWRWSFFSSIVALLLGALILASWPASGLYIIGLFVGIDLLFFGWFYIMAAVSARSLSK